MVDLSTEPIDAVKLGFFSDASVQNNLGFGCILGKQWICRTWEVGFVASKRPSIEFLELFALCAGVLTWEFQLKNIRMRVHCDNQAVVSMINNLTSGCEYCMKLIRLLVLNGLRFNRRIVATCIKSSANVAATHCRGGNGCGLDRLHHK